MRVIFFALFLLLSKSVKTAEASNCVVEGILAGDWNMKDRINDTHDGAVAIGSFKTENIIAMKITKESKYLDANFENNNLQIFTTEQFNEFEPDCVNGLASTPITLEFELTCTEGKPKSLRIQQHILDVNTHDPVFDQKIYEFNFAMTVPKDFDLTVFQTISASDSDFTNKNIKFFIESDKLKIFKIGATGEQVPGNKHDWFTTLMALQNIVTPFEKEFIIVATDDGEPTRSTKATVIVRVTSDANTTVPHPPVFSKHLYFATYTSDNQIEMDEPITIKHGYMDNMTVQLSNFTEYFQITVDPSTKELKVAIIKPLENSIIEQQLIVIEIEARNESLSIPGRTALLINMPEAKNNSAEISVHPPVFSKHLYFANYTLHNEVEMVEPITVKFGAEPNMIIRQSNYSEYFKISQSVTKEVLLVETVKPLSDYILKNVFITIEIEAENKGLKIPGRATLIIRLLKHIDSENNCNVVNMWGVSYSVGTFSLVLFFSAILVIVFLNIIILSLYYKRQRSNTNYVNNEISHRF